MAGGRPSKYRKPYCKMLLDHMEAGLSYEAFAGLIRVSKDTLYEWEKKHPEFSDAKRIGESLARIYWEKVGRDGLYNETIKDNDGMTVTRSINSTIWIFTMKNRLGWRDQKDVKAVVETKDLDQETKIKQRAELFRKMNEKP